MPSYAQTNLQLLNQLQESSYTDLDLNYIVGAYQLATNLFTGQFRASGKTFIAHLVGTASILVSLRASIQMVAAGLLHASYEAGNFSSGGRGITGYKRKCLRQVIGKDAEDYVAKYTALPWNEQSIAALTVGFDRLNVPDRDVLLLRLANELEEYLDQGIFYSGEARYQRYIQFATHVNERLIQLAKQLGFPKLADELEQVSREALLSEVSPAMRRQNQHNTSFLVVPNSHHQRTIGLQPWLSSKIRRLYSIIHF